MFRGRDKGCFAFLYPFFVFYGKHLYGSKYHHYSGKSTELGEEIFPSSISLDFLADFSVFAILIFYLIDQ
jgi:hypothetical protein